MTATQQLQSLARLALLRSDTAGKQQRHVMYLASDSRTAQFAVRRPGDIVRPSDAIRLVAASCHASILGLQCERHGKIGHLAGLNYIRRSLRERAAEMQAGKLQVHHDSRLARSDIIEGYLRPMKVLQLFLRSAFCLPSRPALKTALHDNCEQQAHASMVTTRQCF